MAATFLREPRWQVRLLAALSIVVIVPVGLATKRYPIEGALWIQESSGGALYVVFFCLAALLLWPRARAWVVTAAVLAATCGVEALQLWHPGWLEAIRATHPGDLLLGTTFVWSDFPWYFVGAALAWPWLALVQRPLSGPGRGRAAPRSAPRG